MTPYLEKPRIGPTSSFCSNLAQKLECYIVAGYPEFLEPEDLEKYSKCDRVMFDDYEFANEERNSLPKRKIVGANSAMLYGPKGEWIGGYRKTNLFKTDKTWAAAGVLNPETAFKPKSNEQVPDLRRTTSLTHYTPSLWQFVWISTLHLPGIGNLKRDRMNWLNIARLKAPTFWSY